MKSPARTDRAGLPFSFTSIRALGAVFVKLLLPGGKAAFFQRLAHLGHDRGVEVQVVDGIETRPQDFVYLLQMMQPMYWLNILVVL